MELELSYDSADLIPQEAKALYVEQNGKFVLPVKGVKSAADFTKLEEAKRKETADHNKAKASLGLWGDLKPDEVRAILDEVPALREASKGKLDKAQIDDLVKQRLAGPTSQFERDLKALREKDATSTQEILALRGEKTTRTKRDAGRKALIPANTNKDLEDDILDQWERVSEVTEDGKVLTRDNVGVAPGLDAAGWLIEMQPKRPSWWPASVGGGAKGSGGGGGFGGENPWDGATWNVTKQGQFITKFGKDKAELAAKAAGTTMNGARPALKK